MIRLAAVLSSHELEDFDIEDDEMHSVVQYAELNQNGNTKVPSQFQGKQYQELWRTQMFDESVE